MPTTTIPEYDDSVPTTLGAPAVLTPPYTAILAREGLHLPPDSLVSALNGALGLVERDRQLMHLTDRWAPGQNDPSPFVPGDVPVLRAIVGMPLLGDLLPILQGREPSTEQSFWALHLTSAVDYLYDAKPYFVPADGATMAVLASRPPSAAQVADLRLPGKVLVVFGADMEVPADLRADHPAEVRAAAAEGRDAYARRSWDISAGFERGHLLTGVVIRPGVDGVGLDDWVQWVHAVPPDPAKPPPFDTDTVRGVMYGQLSKSTLRPLVENVAMAVAYGHWHDPADPPPDPRDMDGKERRKAVRKSATRKAVERGTFAGVRVIDVNGMRRAAAPKKKAEEGSRSSPISHMRSAHWRRVRVAKRDDHGEIIGSVQGEEGDDWTYESRWIPPVKVTGRTEKEDSVSKGVTVYRLPSPANS